jgi:hypothetical protein
MSAYWIESPPLGSVNVVTGAGQCPNGSHGAAPPVPVVAVVPIDPVDADACEAPPPIPDVSSPVEHPHHVAKKKHARGLFMSASVEHSATAFGRSSDPS